MKIQSALWPRNKFLKIGGNSSLKYEHQEEVLHTSAGVEA